MQTCQKLQITPQTRTIDVLEILYLQKPTWTNERVQLLKELWLDGVSASLIARKLGGVTRCAVIGKVRRLELPGRVPRKRIPNPPRERVRSGRSAVPFLPRSAFIKPTPDHVPVVTKMIAAEPPLMKPLTALHDGDCHFPIGDPLLPGFGFCAHPRERGPYCSAHAAVTHRGRSR